MNTNIASLYDFSLQQIAAESYFEGIDLTTIPDVKARLRLGTNRLGYPSGAGPSNTALNEGYPGYTRMTNLQADEFVSKYKIVHQWSDNPTPTGSRPAADGILNTPAMLANTGFSATLIRALDANGFPTGEYTLAMRSTEFRSWSDGGDGTRDKWGTDINGLGKSGFALAQLNAMEQYYKWLKDNNKLVDMTKLNVTGYSLGGHLATVFTELHQNDLDIPFGQTVTFNGAGRGTFSGVQGSVTATGLKDMIDFFDNVMKNPMADQALATDAAWYPVWLAAKDLKDRNVAFDDKNLYADPRYKWANQAAIYKYGLSLLSMTSEGRTSGMLTDRISQVVGWESNNNTNFTANSGVHGETVKVGIESQPLFEGLTINPTNFFTKDFGNGHSISLLADSLALQRELAKLDATFSLATFSALLPLASNRETRNLINANYEADVLENVLDAVRRYVLGPSVSKTAFKDGASGFGDITKREGFYANLKELTDSPAFAAIDAKLMIRPWGSVLSQGDPREDFSVMAALLDLSPVYITGVNAPGDAALDALWQSTRGSDYAAWLADKNAGTKTAFSDQWLQDRAALLTRKNYFNAGNASYDSSTPGAWGAKDAYGNAINTLYDGEDIVWEDRQTALKILRKTGTTGNGTTGNTKYVVFGGEGDDTNISGGANNDRLYGGSGTDTYQFSGSWGKDIVCDTDGKGRLTINGHSIGLAQAIGTPGSSTWRYEISPGVSVFLKVVDAAGGGAGKNLVITQGPTSATQGDPANSITIQNFDIDAAKGPTGYLGVMLEPTVKVATTGNNLPAGQSNFFNPVGADVSSLAGQASNVIEGTGKTISVYLNQAAKAGETAVLNLQNLASAGMKAILGDSVVDANGATITLAEGQTEIRFALIQDGALSADVSGSVSVTYNGTGGSVTSNAWGVNLKDAGVASKTYNGDQRAPLNGSGNYDWASTSWASNGTLNGGVAEPGFSDVIRGAADNDTISGLGGNDALDGGAGNDRLDGGTGDDLIGGGAGSDNIRGGDGNDFINSSATLTMGGRVSPTDSWSPPNGQQVITQGARWGIYKDTMPDGTPVTVWGGSNSPAGDEADVVDAGAGNDQVIASGGDDRVQGGLGDDQLDGMGGNDVLEGGDGKDSINGDGRIQTGFLDSVAAPYHGADFVDGGAGDDVLVGGSGADSMDGGTGNNTYVVDNVGDVIVDALGVATNSVAACARQTGVNGRFGSKPHGRHLNTQLLRARAARSTRQSPHARSMRPAGQKWPGRRMNSAQSTLMAGVL